MGNLIFVGIGGIIGAISRYLITLWMNERFGIFFPYGTLVVNIIGCFVIGFVLALVSSKMQISDSWRLFIVTGLTGSLTTFSAFSYDTFVFLQNNQFFFALLNVGTNFVLGISATFLGVLAVKLF